MNKKISDFEVENTELKDDDFIPFVRQSPEVGESQNKIIEAANFTLNSVANIKDIALNNLQVGDSLTFGDNGMWQNVSIANNAVLVVNALNAQNGNGSFANPFKSIDLLCDYIDTNTNPGNNQPNLYGANYTILVFGGSYTTSRNLCNGNTWYFFPGAKIEFVYDSVSTFASRWLFDMNGSLKLNSNISSRYDIRIAGFLEFESSNGLFIRGSSVDTYSYSAHYVNAEFFSVRSTYSTTTEGVIELNQYRPKEQVHTIKGNLISGAIPFILGRLSTSQQPITQGVNAHISVENVFGSIIVNRIENSVLFDNCSFVFGSQFVHLKGARYGSLTFRDCRIGSNTGGDLSVFVVYQGFAAAATLALHDVFLFYGSQSYLPNTTVFDVSDSSMGTIALKVDTLFLRSHDLMKYSSSDSNIADVTSKLTHLYLAGSIRYTYGY